jgi:hypothetical protein
VAAADADTASEAEAAAAADEAGLMFGRLLVVQTQDA